MVYSLLYYITEYNYHFNMKALHFPVPLTLLYIFDMVLSGLIALCITTVGFPSGKSRLERIPGTEV